MTELEAALDDRESSMHDLDQVAIDCMHRIMYILSADWKGRESQLRAQIQCAIIDALEIVK